ncbi:MAG: winged helix-turn-helix transcriptional regulator [Methanoregula sp.]|jgi:predicted transcriptional regulator
MKCSTIIFICLFVFSLITGVVHGSYSVEPYSLPTGSYDSSGADGTVTFFALPLWIQVGWVTGVLLGFFGVIAFGPVVLGRVRDILKNVNRRIIMEYISMNPGCTVSDISNEMQINRGTVKYHIYLLRLERKIVQKKDGKMRYLFKNGRIVPEKKQVFGYIRNPAKREILMTILNEPGISNTGIAEKMQLDKSTVHWHLSQFLLERMVVCEWDGRNMGYQVTADVEEILEDFTA